MEIKIEAQQIPDLYFGNYVLFYADFLSLQDTYTPITDNCKYYYILGMPVNVTYVAGGIPQFDHESKYYVQSYNELSQIRDKYGMEALSTFVRDLCNVFALGCINGEQMLKCILCYDSTKLRKKALNVYKKYMKNIKYTHTIKDDDGNEIVTVCTKYVYHVDQEKTMEKDKTSC